MKIYSVFLSAFLPFSAFGFKVIHCHLQVKHAREIHISADGPVALSGDVQAAKLVIQGQKVDASKLRYNHQKKRSGIIGLICETPSVEMNHDHGEVGYKFQDGKLFLSFKTGSSL